ncbi:hypothetical protein D3C80_2198700 [compost metagenome]
MYGGHANRGRAHAVKKRLEPRASVLVLVLLPEFQQERGALSVSERGQVFLSSRVVIVLEQFGTVVGT